MLNNFFAFCKIQQVTLNSNCNCSWIQLGQIRHLNLCGQRITVNLMKKNWVNKHHIWPLFNAICSENLTAQWAQRKWCRRDTTKYVAWNMKFMAFYTVHSQNIYTSWLSMRSLFPNRVHSKARKCYNNLIFRISLAYCCIQSQ